MSDPVYRIIDWNRHFENNRSRTVENLRWVCVPNRHDGEGYSLLMEQDDAAELFSAWVLILQVASKCHSRGTLVRDDGTPLTAKSLAMKTRGNQSWFEKALNFFTTKVKWMDCQETVSGLSGECQDCDTHLTKKEGREVKGIEDCSKAVGSNIQAIALRISSLVPKWSPHLNGVEQAALFENERKWVNLSEDDWELLAKWYQEDSAVAEFRIQKKAKLIAEVDEELDRASRALKWKQASKSSNPPANWREIAARAIDRSVDGLEYRDLTEGEKSAIDDAIHQAR